MHTMSYLTRRGELEVYFDRTAARAWEKLTSDAPVSRIRATVRAGRDRMRATLLSWLPQDLRGKRILDAGCGTGALATELALRGAQVVAVDLAANLVELARVRKPDALDVQFMVGDMLDEHLGHFDHVVAMDSLIHYISVDIARVLGSVAKRTGGSILFTFAPRTPALALMHAVGRLLPRGDRAPAIEPVSETKLNALLLGESSLGGWKATRTQRIDSRFYISQAMELTRA